MATRRRQDPDHSRVLARTGDFTDPIIRELNEKHAFVMIGGKATIITERYDTDLKRHTLEYTSPTDFKVRYCNRFVRVGKEEIPAGKAWLESPFRRSYDEIICDPDPNRAQDPDVRSYNLWRGWQVKPIKGDWSLMRTHLMTVGADGDEATGEFLLDWFAWMVQQPHLPAETGIVWQGAQGAGKSFIGKMIGKLLGQHFVHVSNVGHLVGKFNGHLQDAVLVLSDEAFWAGDKTSGGALKALVTEPSFMIERKGRDAVVAKNHVHLLVATNHEWAAPLDHDDRRFCVVNVPSYHANDRQYFDAIAAQWMHGGGMQAFLYDMQLRGQDRAPTLPKSLAARMSSFRQKLMAMPAEMRWWYERLREGTPTRKSDGWQRLVSTADIHADYIAAMDVVNVNHRSTESILGLSMRSSMCPHARRVRRVPPNQSTRTWCYEFPPLDDCRQWFADHLKYPQLFIQDRLDDDDSGD